MKNVRLLTICMFILCACTLAFAKDTKAQNKGSAVTLTYAIWDAGQQPGLRKIADEFEATNPGIKIDIQVIAWGDYWTMLEAAGTGGSLPDVFWMHSNEIYKYASNNMLLDLTSLIKKTSAFDIKKYPAGLVSIYNFKGKQYAIPKDFDTIGLWYNKTMFDAAGVKYPDATWTWDTFYDAAKKITNKSKGVYGVCAPLKNQEGYYNFIYENGGTVISADKKKSGYDDPATIAAMEYYVRFVKEGLSPSLELTSVSDSTPGEMFGSGLCAMGFFGSWNLSGFSSNDYFVKNCDVSVLPKGKKQASIFNGLGHAIAYNTKHPAEAWKFVEFLSSKKEQDRQAELGIAISAYEGSSALWVSSNKKFNIKAYIDMLPYAVIRPYSNTTLVWEQSAYTALVDGFTGKASVTDACKSAAAIMNKSLAGEK
jgi:multiple sugar transport system substrate-binding protein